MEIYKNNETTNTNQQTLTKTKNKNLANDTFEVLKENSIIQIQNIASLLFHTKDGLFNAAFYTGLPKECDDGSNLYTIIKLDGKDILIKVGAGEFNTEVFNQKNINKIDKFKKDTYPQKDYKILKGFSRTPIPLFVVSQQDSYFANEEQKRSQLQNPKQYLQEHSIIIIPKRKQAYLKGNNNINFNDINILQPKTAIKKLQTAIFESQFSKKELSEVKNFIEKQKSKTYDKFESTINYFKNNNNNELIERTIYLLKNMVAEKGNIKQMYELIQTYNSKKIFLNKKSANGKQSAPKQL